MQLNVNVSLTANRNSSYTVGDIESKSINVPAPYGYPEAAFGMQPADPKIFEEISFTDSSRGALPTSCN